MEKIFAVGFLTPLENTDTIFKLDVKHLNLFKYTAMIANSESRLDSDLAMARYTGVDLKKKITGSTKITPLENTDTVLQLDVNHLAKNSSMIANTELRDDLDLAMARYNPKSGHFIISMPNMGEDLYHASNDSK